MKNYLTTTALMLLACCISSCSTPAPNSLTPATTDQPAAPGLTVAIMGGMVYSGTDEPPIQADVLIRDERIVGIGNFDNVQADVRLDAHGLAVVPGFIDLHSHAVRASAARSGLFRWPDAENQIRQGVTTLIGGPDGWSPLPLADTFAQLETHPAAVNFGAFVGHGAVRERVVGLDDRPPTADELEAMRAEVDRAMQEGAFGLSSGLVYTPGSFGDTEELIALAEVTGRDGGIYISHMRNENLAVLDSVTELIRIAETAGLPGQITHAKVMGTAMQGRSVDLLAMVDAAVARGVDITLDQYPYTAGSTGLTVQFPLWSRDGGNRKLAERLEDPVLTQKIRDALIYELTEVRGRNNPANVQLSLCPFDDSLNGLNLAEILERQGLEVTVANAADLIIKLQRKGGCQAIYHAMHPEDVITIMQHPRTMIASDGGIEVPASNNPHPRNYGSYARVLGRYVREQNVMPLHTAIHKMTAMPADRIGLKDRGRIRPGAIADIAVLDPARIIDRATFTEPHRYAEGVVHVLVAGEIVLNNGIMTGKRPGKVLKANSDQ